MEDRLPKVLVVSINAWVDNTGINTLINFFKNWTPDEVAQIYTRSAMPNTSVCNEFFQISENAVIKSIFKKNVKTGQVVYNTKTGFTSDDAIAEQKKYSFFRKHSLGVFELMREFAWKLGKWKSKELDDFLDHCNADILFIPIYGYLYMGNLQNYIINRLNKPVVTYIADDVYFYRQRKGDISFYIHRFFQRRAVRKIMEHNNKLMVIAPKLKEVFDKEFNTDSLILTKGIDYSEREFQTHNLNNPIRIVYTGKTNIGRWTSLAMLGRAIEQINKDGKIFELLIYTKDELTDKVSRALNITGASKVMGGISLDEVMKVQQEADIVVFAESLSMKYRDVAWLSFSTKLTDYMANGKCIFAIGAQDIAPIEYLRNEDCAVTASSKQEIYDKLKELANDTALINKYAKKAFECGRKNHDNVKLSKVFKTALIGLYEGNE